MILPMTKKELLKYFKDYREAFPDWTVKDDVVLVRSTGPVEQQIGFENLRAGAYRPSCSVRILCAPPYTAILLRWLDIKHRQILPREHSSKFTSVVNAMEEQFVPAIRRPLDTEEVLQLGEEEAVRDRIDNINHSIGLAALNAYLGRTERALSWCNRVREQLADRGRPLADWETKQADFGEGLREAINSNRETSFLQGMMNP
jgi:hypothetical protein